jgi:hypothetical protein
MYSYIFAPSSRLGKDTDSGAGALWAALLLCAYLIMYYI